MSSIKCILLICSLGLTATAQIMVYESSPWTEIQVAAQAANGDILAAGTGSPWRAWRWNQNWQPSYNNSPWNAWGSSETANSLPAQMEVLDNGWVGSLWDNQNDGTALLQVHNDRMNYPKMRAILGPARLVRFAADRRTNFWVTEAGLNICKAPPPIGTLYRTPPLVHTITVDELWPGGVVTNRLPVSMIEDGHGRMWFWSNYLLGEDSRGSVRGVLIADNDGVTHHPNIISNLNNRISVITPMGESNVWIAVRNQGILSFDIETKASAPVAEPTTNAFQIVQAIFTAKDDILVISGAPNSYDKRGLLSSLWRLRDGKWTRLIDGMDSGGRPEQLADRHWRVTSEGLWLSAFGMGGWFIPNDGSEPRQINWQAGSPFDTIDRWFEISGERMVALQFGQGGLVADAALLTKPPAVNPTSQIIRTSRPLIQTGEGKIFAILRGDESALNEWTGKEWKRHPLPDNLQLWSDCKIASDVKGRVWLIDWNYNPDPVLRPCLILDPVRGRFERYSNFQTALQAQASALADTALGKGDSFVAVFSKDGRICFEDRTWNLRYFDGHEWRQFHLNEIAGGGLRDTSNRSPFFNQTDKLSLILNGTLWQFEELGGWRNTTTPASTVMKPAYAPIANNAAGSPNVPNAESIVVDPQGIFWIVAHKQLFRVGYGMRVPCFPANEPQPFIDGRKLTEVMLDGSGNAFLKTTLQGGEEYVLVPARAPLPNVSAKVQASDASVVVQLSADNTTSPLFSWRADDSAWSKATTNSVLVMDDLSRGRHRLQVVAFDERLQVSSMPAEFTVEIKNDPTEQVQRWIRQLGDKDYQNREAAIRSLGRHPEAALPALRKALDTVSPDKRWWIEAAIQQCEQ